MTTNVHGLHHVTALASDPARNLAFYRDLLGLRLVKLTVNFDDPSAYHLYYGDAIGSPGSILTFFAWAHPIGRGRPGTGQAVAVTFQAPAGSLAFWQDRLERAGVVVETLPVRWGEHGLAFADPDGLPLEIMEGPAVTTGTIVTGPAPRIDPAFSLRRIHSVTLAVRDPQITQGWLENELGLQYIGAEGDRRRLAPASVSSVDWVDLRPASAERGVGGRGTVHHVAWRVPGDPEQEALHARLVERGWAVSGILDRNYFHSIYVREPGGVLCEVATDEPGFAVDEPVESLGSRLILPAQYEPHRAEIERQLPPLPSLVP